MTCNNCSKCSNNEEYQEFVPDKEYSVGEFFKIDKEVFKVVGDVEDDCVSCEFLTNNFFCNNSVCGFSERMDQTSVQFILYDALEENE